MPSIPLYQYDAFTDRVFAGNPAAVCPLDDWLDDETLQAIAAENNLSETAFFVAGKDGYGLRWFTPKVEVDLCGHATLASAAAIFDHLDPSAQSVTFDSNSGPLTVRRLENGVLEMDFPTWPLEKDTPPEGLLDALGGGEFVGRNRDLFVRMESGAAVAGLEPDLETMGRLLAGSRGGVIVTAPADEPGDEHEKADFVSRFFAPQAGIPEDPVTGSAHCSLAPYWAAEFGKQAIVGRQLSARGGTVYCRLEGDRVILGGRCAPYLQGRIEF